MIVRIAVVAFFVVIAFAEDPVAVGQGPPPRVVIKVPPVYATNGAGGPALTGPNGQMPQNYYLGPNGQVPQNYYGQPAQMAAPPLAYYQVPNFSPPVPPDVCAQQAQQVQDLRALVDAQKDRIAELEATIRHLARTNRTEPSE